MGVTVRAGLFEFGEVGSFFFFFFFFCGWKSKFEKGLYSVYVTSVWNN